MCNALSSRPRRRRMGSPRHLSRSAQRHSLFVLTFCWLRCPSCSSVLAFAPSNNRAFSSWAGTSRHSSLYDSSQKPTCVVSGRGLYHRSRAAVALDGAEPKNQDDNHRSAPRLVTALESAVRWSLLHVIFRQCASLVVKIRAKSNLNLFQAKIEHVSLSARNCLLRFRLLSLSRWDITAINLRLGYVPLMLPLLPFLIWKLRRYIWSALFGVLLLQLTGYVDAETMMFSWQNMKKKVWRTLGARPSTIDYSITISKEDVAQSFLLKFWLQSILRSLVDNSVVGAAAAMGDAQSTLQSDVVRERQRQERQRGVPLLPSGANDNPSGALISSNQSKEQSQQSGLITSKLLSATAFELKDASFDKGRVILHAEAVMPPDEKSGKTSSRIQTTTRLPFTIRARVEPTVVADENSAPTNRQQYNALGFVNPECRLNTSPLTAGTLLGKLLPDVVWIPFGLGVAVPFGRRCRIYRADASSGSDGGIFRIDGGFTLFASEEIDTNAEADTSGDGAITLRSLLK